MVWLLEGVDLEFWEWCVELGVLVIGGFWVMVVWMFFDVGFVVI